ncbi:MAG: RraA family protein, partial [Bdellovibrionales bacterium]
MFNSEIIKKISTASLTDAIGRKFSHCSHVLDLQSPTPDRILFGKAVTIQYIPFREDHFAQQKNDFASLFYQAVRDESEGAVLVMSASGQSDASLGGGTKLSRLENYKMAGVLAEGRLRDFHELGSYSFASYCRGETSRWGGDTLMPFACNIPVTFSKVTIYPGDYIYAPRSIAVVIPGEHIEDVLEMALKVEEEDR